MNRSKSALASLVLLVVASLPSGCCSWWCLPCEDGTKAGEPAFPTRTRPPGPGYVFGTADFSAGGVVQVKLQVTALSLTGTIDEGTVQAWSGSGNTRPADFSSLPPAGIPNVYNSGSDVPLPHWTIHLDRTWNESATPRKYWIVVKVDRDAAPGNSRVVKWLWWEWTPDSNPDDDLLDPPHDFTEYLP